MSKNKNQNKNQTSYEEQNRQLVDALYEQKLVKPTCSDCIRKTVRRFCGR